MIALAVAHRLTIITISQLHRVTDITHRAQRTGGQGIVIVLTHLRMKSLTMPLPRATGNDIDDTRKCIRPVNGRLRPAHNLDTLDHIRVEVGEVITTPTRVCGVIHLYTVNQHQGKVGFTPADRYGRETARTTLLLYQQSRQCLEQIGYARLVKRGDLLVVQYRYVAGDGGTRGIGSGYHDSLQRCGCFFATINKPCASHETKYRKTEYSCTLQKSPLVIEKNLLS